MSEFNFTPEGAQNFQSSRMPMMEVRTSPVSTPVEQHDTVEEVQGYGPHESMQTLEELRAQAYQDKVAQRTRETMAYQMGPNFEEYFPRMAKKVDLFSAK